MDNNSFNAGANNSQNISPNMPNMQNMQGMSQNMQPGMQGMSQNMGMPMGPGGMGPNMNQPQYPMRPSKQPMDPEKKKHIIMTVSLISGLIVVGVALAIILPIVFRVDYSSAYATVKELQTNIYNIHQSRDCENVVDYMTNEYTSVKIYDEYVEKCKKVYNSDTNSLVDKLENTDGVKRNEDIKAQFGRFKIEYEKLEIGDGEELNSKLKLWQARHNYIVAMKDLSYRSSDAEFAAATDYLINSGNEALKTYGEGLLKWYTEITAAYRAYYNAPLSESTELGNIYRNKDKEFDDWVATNKPEMNTVAPLNFNDTSKMYVEFGKLKDLIAKIYSENYNSGSGDCTEFMGVVSCE